MATSSSYTYQCLPKEADYQVTDEPCFQLRRRKINNTKRERKNVLKSILSATIILSIIILIFSHSTVEASKKKEKKIIKQLVKGLIFKNLSTKKNILPLPVPIPVPIEVNEPPVYLKGKPKYVTIYKPAPPPTPAPAPPPTASAQIYHMPVYSPTYAGHYPMPDPMSMYGTMMMNAPTAPAPAYPSMAHMPSHHPMAHPGYYGSNDMNQLFKPETFGTSSVDSSFTDYDDDIGNYYVRSAASELQNGYSLPASSTSSTKPRKSINNSLHDMILLKRVHQGALPPSSLGADVGFNSNSNQRVQSSWIRVSDEQEAIDDYGGTSRTAAHKRIKRQASDNYQAHQQVHRRNGGYYEREPPCYGFPLEVNIKSRIKLDQVFPIFGNSQLKKCIKVGKPILPPPDENGDHIHVIQKVY